MRSRILAILAVFSILIVAGCTSTSEPSVTITSPTDGQIIDGNTVTITLSASNIKLAAPNGTVVEGEGHFHVWLDNANEKRGPMTSFAFDGVVPGAHTFKVELHKGDHSPYLSSGDQIGDGMPIIDLVTFATAASGTLPPVSTVGPTKEFNMTADKFDFEPSTITVNKGDRVVLHITSTDVEHGFSLATYNIIETLPVGETKTISFTADQVGEFNFFCSVFCGSGHSDMRGKLIVNP